MSKNALIQELRLEKEAKVLTLFSQSITQLDRPISFKKFWEKNGELISDMYSESSLYTLFRKFIKNGQLIVTHYKDKPTPFLISKQEFITPNFVPSLNHRSWLIPEEKTKLREQFTKEVQQNPTNELVKKQAINFIGSFPTKEENLNFISGLCSQAYHHTQKPMTSEELTHFILGDLNEPDTYTTILEIVRQAKSFDFLKNVYPKNDIHSKSYFVPSNLKHININDRDWYYTHERNKVRKEQWNIEREERLSSDLHEKEVYEELLKRERLDIYLVLKINRLMWVPKKKLIELKVSNYNPFKRSLTIKPHEEIDRTVDLILDTTTNQIMSQWFKLRNTYPTAKSPYLFITPNIYKLAKHTTYTEVFRRIAKEKNYIMSSHYSDRIGFRHMQYEPRTSFSITDEIQRLHCEWFYEIENAFVNTLHITEDEPGMIIEKINGWNRINNNFVKAIDNKEHTFSVVRIVDLEDFTYVETYLDVDISIVTTEDFNPYGSYNEYLQETTDLEKAIYLATFGLTYDDSYTCHSDKEIGEFLSEEGIIPVSEEFKMI